MRNFFLLFLFSLSLSLTSQVTIGSSIEPNQGALLDLKQFLPTEKNATATKGIQLPRVKLKKISGDLSESLGLNEAADNLDHIGLVVYNITDSECPLFPSGVYTWNGSKWDILSGGTLKSLYSYTESIDGSGLGVLTDYEGNEYATKRFEGTINGETYSKVWMTQNLRSLKNAEGEWINCPGGVPLNPAIHRNPEAKASVMVIAEIPDGTVEPYTYRGVLKEGQSYKDFSEEFGFFYTQEQRNAVCPEGWHLPTRAEWEGLLAVMGDNAINKMKAYPGEKFGPIGYTPDGGQVRVWGTYTAESNGFNLLPAGYVETPANNYIGHSFAQSAQLWAADARFGIAYNSTSISFSTSSTGLHLSVRCLKD